MWQGKRLVDSCFSIFFLMRLSNCSAEYAFVCDNNGKLQYWYLYVQLNVDILMCLVVFCFDAGFIIIIIIEGLTWPK